MGQLFSFYGAMMMLNDLSGCPVSSVFLSFAEWSWKESKSHLNEMQCVLLFFSSSEWSWNESISLNMMHNPGMVLKWDQNTM